MPVVASADRRPLGRLPGRLVLLGFGSIGQAILPLLFDRLGLERAQVTVLKAREDATGCAERVAGELGLQLQVQPLDAANLEAVLGPLLAAGDFLLNLSVNVSSLALVKFCTARDVLYLDACNEPWPGRYDNPAGADRAQQLRPARGDAGAARAAGRQRHRLHHPGRQPGPGLRLRQGRPAGDGA